MAVIFFTILAMSDGKSAETPVVVASQASHVTPSSQTTMNRPPLPQVKPPPPLNLADCSAKKWKSWKQAWLNFAIVSKISTQTNVTKTQVQILMQISRFKKGIMSCMG